MTPPDEIRILCSPAAADTLRQALPHDGRRYILRHPEPGQACDAQVAFVSRDITGASTKFSITPDTARYYEAMRHAPALRWVHVHSAGADREIYQSLHARGVTITTSQGATDAVVAQTAIGGVLALARRFALLAADQRDHAWRPLLGARTPRDLSGQHAVLVGWGGIGQRIGALLTALGLALTVVRHSATAVPQARRTAAYGELPGLLHDADWLVLACPLTPATRELVSRDALAALPAHAMVVNVARGHVIDEPALIDALAHGRLGGAFLDVFQQEPLPPESPLWALDNVIVTPHSAGFSDGNAARVRELFLNNLRRWAQGEALINPLIG